jgi:Domain of unknown function (DUF4434)
MKIILSLLVVIIGFSAIQAQNRKTRRVTKKPIKKTVLTIKSADTTSTPKRINGAFIQYDGDSPRLKQADWTAMLDKMREAEMKTIVIQWLFHTARFVDPPLNLDFMNTSDGTDETGEILEYAKRHNMQVFLGLWFDDNWWTNAESANQDYFKEDGVFVTESKRVAQAAWERYGSKYKDTIAGWYIPQETWNVNYDETQINTIRAAFKSISKFCKEKLANKPVAFSPIFSPVNYPSGTPEVVEKVYADFLANSGIDIVMLQDGAGARCWHSKKDLEDNLPRYFAAFSSAAKKASEENKKSNQGSIKLWADTEVFVGTNSDCKPGNDGKDFRPACLERIKMQLELVAPYVENIVAFDFNHYMDPVTPDSFVYQKPLCERKRLYYNYLSMFVPENTSYKSFKDNPSCAPVSERFCLK